MSVKGIVFFMRASTFEAPDEQSRLDWGYSTEYSFSLQCASVLVFFFFVILKLRVLYMKGDSKTLTAGPWTPLRGRVHKPAGE